MIHEESPNRSGEKIKAVKAIVLHGLDEWDLDFDSFVSQMERSWDKPNKAFYEVGTKERFWNYAYHWAIGEKVIQLIPPSEVAYHCPDEEISQCKRSRIFDGGINSNSIGIIIDFSVDPKIIENHLKTLLKRFNWKISKDNSLNFFKKQELPTNGEVLLLRHKDVTNKSDPSTFIQYEDGTDRILVWKKFIRTLAK